MSKQHSEELADALRENQPRNGVCVVHLINDIPSPYNATIVAGGSKFVYVDNTSTQDGPRQLALRFREQADFFSVGGTNCVTQVFPVCSVQVGGSAPVVFTGDPIIAPPGKCAREVECRIAPKALLSENEVKKGKLDDLFEIEFKPFQDYTLPYEAKRNTEWVSNPLSTNPTKGTLKRGDRILFSREPSPIGATFQDAKLEDGHIRFVHPADFKKV